ncbi:RidA family protein [Paenarthrobacter sp. JL.01a]|uniref:RidA family protein n=1 Tax=Paenarthrobacter sp. JL.01a TaxID=2979324 RepID=UPI0021C77026|nr:RidA family protein [Paenarthrobacter sp. JL.01a]UXM93486.1 RidA family protein [Paenarthrobacter sp. JL.01a]
MAFSKPNCADFVTLKEPVLLSGIVGVTDEWECSGDDFSTQARQAFANAKRVVDEAGRRWEDVAFVRAFLADITHYKEYSALFDEMFTVSPPARTTVQAGLVGPFLVELEITVNGN